MPSKKKTQEKKSQPGGSNSNDTNQLDADNLNWEIITIICEIFNIPGVEAYRKQHADNNKSYENFLRSKNYQKIMSQAAIRYIEDKATNQELLEQITSTASCLDKIKALLDADSKNGDQHLDELVYLNTLHTVIGLHQHLVQDLGLRIEAFNSNHDDGTGYIIDRNNSEARGLCKPSLYEDFSYIAEQTFKGIQLFEYLEKNYNNFYKQLAPKTIATSAYTYICASFRLAEFKPESCFQIYAEMLEKLKSLKNKLLPWQYYSSMAKCMSFDNPEKAKLYLLKTKAAILNLPTMNNDHLSIMMTRSMQMGMNLLSQIAKLDDSQKARKLELLKETRFYSENAMTYADQLFTATFTTSFSNAISVRNLRRQIDNRILAAQQNIGYANFQIFKIKEEMLKDIKSDFLIFETNNINIADKNVRFVKPYVKLQVKLPEYAMALKNLCHAQAINCRLETDPETNIVSIVIPDLINTSLVKLETAISHWHRQLPRPKSVEEEKPKISPAYSEDNITNFEVVKKEEPTKTAAKKLKKKKEIAGPSIKEQIKTAQMQKQSKPNKKITWAGTMNQPGYTYDEGDKNCKVYRLYGDTAKRHYVYIDPRLHAKLADEYSDYLTILENLCINGTVLSHSEGHSAFITSGSLFDEQREKLDIDFSDSSIPNTIDQVNNNNTENNNANPASAMSITYLKGKNAGNQVRFFGSTERVTTKNGKTYNLVRIHGANLTK